MKLKADSSKSLSFMSFILAIVFVFGLQIEGSYGQFGPIEPMMQGLNGYTATDILTIGQSLDGYTPPGVIDGLGAYELNNETVRVFANHELLHFRGYEYTVNNGSITMTGARVSYFDIDKNTRQIVDAGLAYDTIYDANGNIPTDIGFLANDLNGLSRLCSSGLSEAEQFGNGKGLVDRIYFTGEEDGGGFNAVGGAEWALNPETKSLWPIPAMGRGAWENITEVCTGSKKTVAFVLADDTSPFDVDDDGVDEGAPIYLYIGEKNPEGDFLAQNGLRDGKLYVWVAKNPNIDDPRDFNSKGSRTGDWVEIDNSPTGTPSEDGSTGFDEYGYPTQRTLWSRAEQLGAFQFSRPEDVATNPRRCNQIVLASTGRDTDFDGSDRVGTTYSIRTNFKNMKAKMRIIYDGDADPTQELRSPDNLDWADDGSIYVQEDKAVDDIFETGVNSSEAGIVKLNSRNGKTQRIAVIDRSVVLDASITPPTDAVDVDAGVNGEWESSGILDVSNLFGGDPGTLFLFDVQAHGIEDQDEFNEDSRIQDGDLVEGGQLLFLEKN